MERYLIPVYIALNLIIVCTEGWWYHNRITKFGPGLELFGYPRTYKEAKETCEGQNRILVELRSQIMKDFIAEKAYYIWTPIWIGASDRTTEAEWVWESNGDPVEMPQCSWSYGSPSCLKINSKDCAVMKQYGNVEDTNCYKRLPFVCQEPDFDIYDSIYLDNGECSSGALINGTCYEFFPTAVNYDKALKTCKTDGGTLLEIRSQGAFGFQQQVFENIESGTKTVWLGATDRADEGLFVWETDFEGVEGGKFAESDDPPKDDCFIVIEEPDIKDRVIPVDCVEEHVFICQKPSAPPKLCAARVDDSCYQFFAEPKNYEGAQITCSLHNGTVAETRTEEVQNVLIAKAAETGQNLWTGASRAETEFVWRSDNEEANILDNWWDENQPDSSGDCMAMQANGRLDDVSCLETNVFLCRLI